MKTELLHILFEKGPDDTCRQPIEWCKSLDEAKRRSEELASDSANDGYKYSYCQLPGIMK
jgi:hypothetical protein